jgi:hypothetical protein
MNLLEQIFLSKSHQTVKSDCEIGRVNSPFKNVRLFWRLPAEASAQGPGHRQAEGDVPDGDDDEGEDERVVLAVRRIRFVVVSRRGAVDVVTSGYEPAGAERGSEMLEKNLKVTLTL